MTDEQIGREWCERNGKAPAICLSGRFSWEPFRLSKYADRLPKKLYEAMPRDEGRKNYETQAEAYAAVGAALRQFREILNRRKP